MIWLFIH